MSKPYRIGIIGVGSMGRRFLSVLRESARWDLVWAYNRTPEKLRWARDAAPEVRLTSDVDDIFNDDSLDVIGIFTLADVRPQLLRRALELGKHVIAEKPLAATNQEEWALLEAIEASDRLVAVNMFNRSAWYHHEIQQFIARGEIGELAVIRISHQTQGLMPTEGHAPEGPPFHNCGMHYVDVARWYAGSEYDTWHAQGLRMWDWPEPWWTAAQGSFKNGVVFQITIGFAYGQMAKDSAQHCAFEVIGTQGVARMSHDFRDATIEYFGTATTARKVGPYGDKNIDVLCDVFARSLDAGRNLGFPIARDSVLASQLSQDMLDFATAHAAPSVGSQAEMQRILAYRKQRS